MSATGVSTLAADRTLAASLLARWWSRPVEEETADWADAWAAASDVGVALACDVAEVSTLQAAAERDEGTLVEEHERLFVGPGRVPCPPYEALWRDEGQRREQGRLMSTATAAVARLYRTLDLAVRHDAHELPDHIAVELEALAYALGADTPEHETAEELLSQHLLLWVPKLCEVVERESELDFSRVLARLTPGWLAAIARQATP
jgi:putative dimethyl sulfoxide reductase chaperone